MGIEGVQFLEHPADIGIEARGDTRAIAFGRAAAALVSLIVDPSTIRTSVRKSIILHASDADQLLVRWLSEVLYLYDGTGFIAGTFEITICTPTQLEATVGGEAYDCTRHTTRLDVKAITYHQLAVLEDSHGWRVRAFLDI
jgi:SHS2 domain-containing protein